MTDLEKKLLEALVGLRGSSNGFESCWCGEMPHEDDCQAALDAVAAAKKAGAKLFCPKCGVECLTTLRADGQCDDCWDLEMRSYGK